MAETGRARDTADDDDATAEAAAAERADEAQYAFLVPAEAGHRHGQPGSVGEAQGHVEVVGDAFQLGVDGADVAGSVRHAHPGKGFDSVCVGQGVGDGGDALDPFGEADTIGDGHGLEAFLDATVLVERA